jgi:gamma-glutamylcyclotransferase (GGCT)/AIG2-like uncharacterized protein YtfP
LNAPGLFVYGTLHPDRAPAEMHEVVRHFVLLGEGTVMGRLLDLGDYPGLVRHGPQQPVPGHVYAFPEETISALDAYEGFDPACPNGSLFLREKTAVTMADGSVEEHWIYLFQGR